MCNENQVTILAHITETESNDKFEFHGLNKLSILSTEANFGKLPSEMLYFSSSTH